MNEDIYIARFSSCSENPDISFTDPMFRRRLSTISKMTIKVVHDILPIGKNTKMMFASFRGEVSRQYSINKMVIQDNAIMPAAFSLSVFNAPAALASMALGLKGGYSAVYPGKDSLLTGLAAARAAILGGTEDELVFVYADEAVPPEYEPLCSGNYPSLAFAMLLKRKKEVNCVFLSTIANDTNTPLDLINKLKKMGGGG